jgi:hypothetical protein
MERDFWLELIEFYNKKRWVINRELRLSRPGSSGDSMLLDFCTDINGSLSRHNLCRLALIFSNVTGERLPDNLHARMVLGEANQPVREYIEYLKTIKPKFMGFNPNKNNFKTHTLGVAGYTRKMALK